MTVLQAVVTIAISVIVAYATAKTCTSRWGGNFKKVCAACCIVSVFTTAGSILLHGLGMHNIQTIFLSSVFLYASYGDIKTHEADDFIHIIVLAAALINKPAAEIPSAILSAVLLGGILLGVAVFVGGAGIGGADIKFTAACAFLTTLEGGLFGLGLGTFAALLCNSPFRKKEGAGEGFPMLPYLSCSYMLIYLLS